MKIGICVALYNPKSILIENYKKLFSDGFELFFYLNSEIVDYNFKEFIKIKNIKTFGNGENIGLSKAFNEVASHAINFTDYLLFLDQDTKIDSLKLIEFLNKTEIKNYSLNNHASLYFFNEKKDKTPTLITNSGNLVFLKNFKKQKIFNELFFVEMIDYHFYIFSLINKMKITKYNVDFIDHASAQNDISFYFFNMIKLKNYSKTRINEINYNSFLLIKSLFNLKTFKYFLKFTPILILHLIISNINYVFSKIS